MVISSYSLAKSPLVPGEDFSLTVTAKNNMGSAAAEAALLGSVRIRYTNSSGLNTAISYTFTEVRQSVSWANNATKTLTFKGTVESMDYFFNRILKDDPDAEIRYTAIAWTLNLFKSGNPAEVQDYGEFQTGYLLNWRYAPQIESFILERSLDGVPNDEGESLLATLKLGIADKPQMEKQLASMYLKLHYSDAGSATISSPFIDLTASIPDLLAGVTDNGELITQTFVNISNWNFLLVFGDAYESASAALSVSRAFANVHLSGKSTGGVAFGGFSTAEEGDPKFESHYPAHFYAGISDFGGSVQGGTVTRTNPSVPAQSYKSYDVTFPIPFKEVPVVTCTLYSWSTSYYMGGFCLAISAGTITKTGFTVNCYNSTSSARDFHLAWIAIGKM